MTAEMGVAIINVGMWLGVSSAVIVALLTGHGISVLWFFLIPMFGGMYTKSRKIKKGDDGDE